MFGEMQSVSEKRIWQKSFYLDQEKDIIVDLFMREDGLSYRLKTPNHGTGNLITNLAKLCALPLSRDEQDMLIIRGNVPCYIDGYNRTIYIFRLGNTKVANIFPDGRVEMKAHIPAISKTLMSQTKDYRLDIGRTIVKTYIRSEYKFRTDLHTHMNANLSPDILIALGICHELRYPLYYVKKLKLRCSEKQWERLEAQRATAAEQYKDCGLTGKYLTRRIDDHTYINFADLLLNNPEDAAYNISRIRTSLTILKDGQAVFTNLEKVYLYRYVFAKGQPSNRKIGVPPEDAGKIPDPDIRAIVAQILEDRKNPVYRENSVFQDKLLWIARSYAAQGIRYAEISDTALVKRDQAPDVLAQMHAVLPAIYEETGVLLRFLAALRRIPLTIVKDQIVAGDYFRENLEVLRAVEADPYVAGSDIIGEEINDIRDVQPVIREIVRIASKDPSFVVRIHAGENDGLRDNVANSVQCVKEALAPGQRMPLLRIGHGLYTPNLNTRKGQALIRELQESGAVLEFQITSNVRLNNLSSMAHHPLRQYLRYGISCVQGTDGGALYGTSSIDEQLALEKMLNLNETEFMQMRESEEKILRGSLRMFAEKKAAWEKEIQGTAPQDSIVSFYKKKIAAQENCGEMNFSGKRQLNPARVFADRIEELPQDGLPVVIVGGSFNNDHHATKVREDDRKVIDELLCEGDPEKLFFVVGHSVSGYERYLIERNRGKFRIYAMVPSMLSAAEYRKLRESGVKVRVSIEPVAMGLYKSLAYEIFKRRASVLIAFDGNSSGANMIQEAKNGKYPCRIFVSRHSRMLRSKAETLGGYVRLFGMGEPHLTGIGTAREILSMTDTK